MSDEIECEQCGLVLPYDQFSKAQRKLDDPCCKRCVAWVETQEPEIPAGPLATGHVSWEEKTEVRWVDDNKVLNEPRLKIPMVNRGTAGSEDHDDDSPEGRDVRAMGRGLGKLQVGPPSVSDAAPRKLPPHLQRRVQSSKASSTAGSVATSESGGETLSTAPSQNLPPHLRKKTAESISTATTLREEREDDKKWNSKTFHAYGPNGESGQRVRPPSTAASTGTSDLSAPIASKTTAVTRSDRPAVAAQGSTPSKSPGGEPQGSLQGAHTKGETNKKWAKPSRAPRGYTGESF